LILSEKELIEITNNTLDVKFADRIHNLSTQWDPNDLETVRRKIEETKKYFLSIAKEISKEAFEKLKNEILILEIKLNNTS
jgi:(p)ppGpp synthase/HD superfamily hydrolase